MSVNQEYIQIQSQSGLKNQFNQDPDNQQQLEQSMKELLEKMLTFIEKFIKTKEDLQAVEEKLNDYDNLLALNDIIKSIFVHLSEKIDQAFENQKTSQQQEQQGETEYEALEKIVQKHESEIRTHIRLEQQLKLFIESLQSKLDESEKTRSELLESTKNMINEIKRDNQGLNEQLNQQKIQTNSLQQKLNQIEREQYENQEKLKNYPYMQEKIYQLEKIVSETKIFRQTGQDPLQTNNQISNMSLNGNSSLNKYDNINLKLDYQKQKLKSETPTPGMKQKSPLKERRAPTPTLDQNKNNNNNNNDYLKVKIEIGQKPKKNQDIRNSYQRFCSKVTKEEQSRNGNINMKDRDVRTISQNGSQNGSNNASFLIGNNQNKLQQNISHNQSIINNSNTSAGKQSSIHKRSKSHTQHNYNTLQKQRMNKGMDVQQNGKNQEYSRLSNPDFNDIFIQNPNNQAHTVGVSLNNNQQQQYQHATISQQQLQSQTQNYATYGNQHNNNKQIHHQHSNSQQQPSHHYNRSISALQQM